jgi:signal peptidase I
MDIPCDELFDDTAFVDELIGIVEKALEDRGIRQGRGAFESRGAARRAKRRKAWNIISNILFYGLLAAIIAGAFLLSQGDKKPILGYSFANVLTWSMESEIPQGSLVIIKTVDPKTIQIGDDITYMKDTETSVTHRVIGITEDHQNSGERGFETQGVDNDAPDFEIVPASNVAGKVVFHMPMLGSWLNWLRENLLWFAGFVVGFVLLIVLLKGAFEKKPAQATPQKESAGKKKRRKSDRREHRNAR